MNYHNSNGSEFLNQVNSIISENLDNNSFGVSEMAVALAMSRSSLYRKFREATDVPVNEFIRRFRLERSKVLLKNSSATISEIAYACGFTSLAYFDISFKANFGYTPGDFRELIKSTPLKQDIYEVDQNWLIKPHELKPLNELHNFPVAVTSFVGRLKEIQTLHALLKVHRIISLTGIGGCGKTRLAIELIRHLDQRFNDGVWFVDLSSLDEEEFVVKEIMKSMHILEVAGEELIDTLVGKLQLLDLLIVLDNCEHVATAAAFVAGKLIRSVPGLKIICTSRKVLNIEGEKVWHIPPLNLVDPDKVSDVNHARQSEAVLLFLERARLVDQQFELVPKNSQNIARICYELDGLPLAIELVASRIRHLDPSSIVEKLKHNYYKIESRDSQSVNRQKTIRHTIEWSYRLLLNEQKELFKRLSVFSGDFDLQAVQAICADKELPEKYIHGLLSDLVDCSMIQVNRKPGQYLRYYMLKTISQYVNDLNSESQLNRLRKKHFNHFHDLAEVAYQERMSNQAVWMEKLGLEFDNMISALHWAGKYNRQKYYSLAGLLGWWWTRSGYIKLAAKVLGDILDEGKVFSATKARVMASYSWAISGSIDRLPDLIMNGIKAAAIWRKIENKAEEAIVLSDLALTKLAINDNEDGYRYALQAQGLARQTGEEGVILYALCSLSQSLVNLERCEEALVVIREIRELADKLDHNFGRFAANHNAGDCAAMRGDYDIARKYYAEGLKCCLKIGDMPYALNELMGIAITEAGLGNCVKALRLAGADNEAAKKIGIWSRELLPMQFWQELIHEHIGGAREKLGKDLHLKSEAEGAAMAFEEAVSYALEF